MKHEPSNSPEQDVLDVWHAQLQVARDPSLKQQRHDAYQLHRFG
jgi:hypothetical protein